MSIEIEGLDAVFASLNQFAKDLENKADNDVQNAGQQCADLAKQVVHVRSGELRDSITYVSGHLECEVTADAGHALFLEFGTRKMSPAPFLIPSFMTTKDDLTEALSKP